MFRKFNLQFLYRVTTLLCTLLILGGCLAEEAPAPGDDPNPDDDTSGDTLKSHALSGSVGDGPVVSAEVHVETRDGSSLGTASSDSGSDYTLVVKTQASDYPLQLSANGGTDLVTAAAPDFTLRGAVMSAEAESVANLNPFTTVAMEIATDLPGGRTAENLHTALDVVVDEFGNGLSSMNGAETLAAPIDAGNIAEIVKSSEAAGEVVRRTRDALVAVGRNVSGNGVVAAIGSDLTDSVLDGRGGSRADPRTAAIANITMAQVMLESMANRLRVQGTDATDRLNSAIGQVFSGTPSPALADLPITDDMIAAARLGLMAGGAFQPSTEFQTVLQQLDELQAGMRADEVANVLDTDVSSVVDALVLAVAAANSSEVEVINDVARTGQPPAENSAPEISGTPPATITVGSNYSFQPAASDDDGDSLTFSISGKPAWASFSTSSGALTGTPAENDTGASQGIVISVTDGEETVSLPAFTLTVMDGATNGAPEISGSPSTQVTAGSSYGFTPSASDPDGDSLTFSVSNAPSWTSFDTATGSLTGTPQSGDVGNYNGISIRVTDGEASASLQAFSINVVAPAPTNSPPQISGNAPDSVTVGEEYSFIPTASDADGDTLTFSVTGLPSEWLQFNVNTGRLRGTPGSDDVGTHGSIVISVSDGQATRSLPAIEITVSALPNNAPSITGSPSGNVTANSAYDFRPTASDPDGDNLTFSITGLPGWASFNVDTGRLQGTPDDGDVGTYSNIRISVSDGDDSDALSPFSITVAAMPTTGSATLTWTAPTQNEDGTPLTDLSGYKIYWGTSPGNYTQSATINNVGLTTYVVDNLSPGTWSFVSTAINAEGVESDYSNVATKTIQ